MLLDPFAGYCQRSVRHQICVKFDRYLDPFASLSTVSTTDISIGSKTGGFVSPELGSYIINPLRCFIVARETALTVVSTMADVPELIATDREDKDERCGSIRQ